MASLRDLTKPLLAAAIAAGASLVPWAAAAQSRITIAINTLGPETWWPQDIANNKYLTGTIGDPLVRLVSPYKLEPALASSWKVSDDGLTYEFTIRNDVLFHDGSKLTAEDAAFTFAPENAQNYVGFSRMKNGNIVSVEAQGDRVIMKLKEAIPFMIDGYISRISIRPKAYLQRVGVEGFNKQPIGTGPFKVVEHVKSQHVKMVANDNYFGGRPKVDELIWRVVPEPATRLAMLRNGEADVTYNELGASTGELQRYGMRAVSFGLPRQSVLVFNHLLRKENLPSRFADVRVRRALTMAIDREAVANAIYFGKDRAAALLIMPRDTPSLDPKYRPLAYDPVRAKALLAEAGLSGGFKVDLYAPNNLKDLAVLMVSYWQRIGIDAKLSLLDPASLNNAWFNRTLSGDAIILSQILANGVASLVYLDPAAQVVTYYSPETDALRVAGTAIVDPARQDEWFLKVFAPKLDQLYPVPVILEGRDGVFGLGQRVKDWSKFELHAMGFQWLTPQ
ncbi:ABC transporter substrate-binding protein [Vineibacter terrae]|uniref:ABC transporter substrate-binding protein n=1 Tax=Vineibacter terrae TaxID=2586908 RepID=A0A5C8PSA8_9HYPH|nr:ABC transporter substrate-binding protein [Vineibacter terrae]TXL79566.1 ABC transporter substrate-binding protein [Vineibacter terrae]